jgi:hypothetical protein
VVPAAVAEPAAPPPAVAIAMLPAVGIAAKEPAIVEAPPAAGQGIAPAAAGREERESSLPPSSSIGSIRPEPAEPAQSLRLPLPAPVSGISDRVTDPGDLPLYRQPAPFGRNAQAADPRTLVRQARFHLLGCAVGAAVGVGSEFAGLLSYVLPAARSALPVGVGLGAVAIAGCALGAGLGQLVGN